MRGLVAAAARAVATRAATSLRVVVPGAIRVCIDGRLDELTVAVRTRALDRIDGARNLTAILAVNAAKVVFALGLRW